MVRQCAVIIPVHNHIELTKSALKDLNEKIPDFSDYNFHIVIVDDGSTDGTADWIISTHPYVHVLRGDGNLWWSGGINMGVRYAIDALKADYIILWNNDITIEPNYFIQLVKIWSQTDENIIIGSKILVHEKPDLIWAMGGYFNPYNGKYGMYSYFEPNINHAEPVEVDWLPGMGTAIHKSVISNIGYWNDKDFPQYHGDSDYTYRAFLKGYKIKVYPDLVIYNKVKNTGIHSNTTLRSLIIMFKDIRSKVNLRRNFLFYKKYAKSPLAYHEFLQTYFKVIFGFIKWRILGLAGIRKITKV